MDVTVTDNPERRRYEANADGQLVAIAEYVATGDSLVFIHTQSCDGFESSGAASALIRSALDDVRRRHMSVIAMCPFVKRFIEQNQQEYGDLVHRSRSRFIHD
ncbi:GNAT family N-acetyltransferase [Micromonospora sp. CA-259024]|uniref:GNAT family N-acetyltransferase n=1 Tax=Micromonospora sp. CA-259024 TaxID=3239965 RepID=UPI003D94740D